jgi:hypothetical protein
MRASERVRPAMSTRHSRTSGATWIWFSTTARASTISVRVTRGRSLPAPAAAGLEAREDLQLRLAVDVVHLHLEEEAVELRRREGKVPARSSGFCVAMTKKSSSSLRVRLSMVVCFSAIASSMADCTFGEVRLISSASTMCAKMGPARKKNLLVLGSKIVVPVTSEGSRSGVNWMRRKVDDVVVGLVVDDAVAEGLGEGGLARAGVVLEQHVAVGEQGDDEQLDDLVAAAHRRLQPRLRRRCTTPYAPLRSVIGGAGVWVTCSLWMKSLSMASSQGLL